MTTVSPPCYQPTLLNGALDAFGRLRVSEPFTQFDSQQIKDSQPLFWDDAAVSGGGTSTAFVTNNACTRIGVSNLTAGHRVRQSKRPFYYQAGKGALRFLTFVMGAAAAGITRLAGQGDADNGLFLRQTGAGPAFVRRTFTSGVAVDNVVLQASWNVDTLDGSGNAGNPSGIALDLSLFQILMIAYEWLGGGTVAFGFVLDGQLIVAHVMQNANALDKVYMSVPDLPLRYSIQNDGTGPAATLDHVCCTVISEGGRENTGFPYAIERLAVLTTLNDADFYPLIAIRLRSGYTYAEVVPTDISVVSTTNAFFAWKLILNPTVTGTALSFTTLPTSPAGQSAIETDITRTSATKVSGGTTIAAGVGAIDSVAQVSLPSDFALGSTIAGVADILVLAVSRITAGAENFFGTMGWRESR